MPLMLISIGVIFGLILLAFLLFFIRNFNLWLQATLSGAPIRFLELVGMRLRKTDPRVIVFARIRAVKAGFDIATNKLEIHHLAGGRVASVVTALITADRAKIELPWNTACALDLAGYDVVQAVHIAAEQGLRPDELTPTFLNQINAPRAPAPSLQP